MRNLRSFSIRTVLRLVAVGITIIGFTIIAATAINAWADPAPTTVVFNDQPAQQNPAAPATMVDPQARVGRISLINGTVSFHTPDQNSWSYATLNYPVVSGNSFWTEPNSRAEIQIGSTAIRLDGSTEVDINELDDRGTRVDISQGVVNLHVSNIANGEVYQIITPHETINLLQPGTYRIQTGGDNAPDQVAVLRGRTQVGDPETLLTVSAGETAVIHPGNPPAIAVQETAPTAFDNWSLERDNFEEPRQVARYVSPEMTGYEDLERYGNWQADPAYGNVWIPTEVPVGWAPYHYGHWVWVSPWGWTWVDETPWGFAPFHYGRWAYARDRWCWIPGRIAPRPIYAPALVAFIGGPSFGLSIGIGEQPVGWFPLGPNEVYRPGYHVSHDYIRNVNVTNVTNIDKVVNVTSNDHNGPRPQNSFANRRFATVVAEKDFAASHSVAQVALHVPAEKLAAASVNTVAAPPTVISHPASSQNAPHGNFVPEAHGPDRRVGGEAPLAEPSAPHSPSPPTQPNVAHETQNHEEAHQAPVVAAAPGPPIQHRDRPPGYQPTMHINPAAQMATPVSASSTVSEPHSEHPAEHINAPVAPREPTVEPVHQPDVRRAEGSAPLRQQVAEPVVQRPAPRELEIPHPQQAAPLVPSHQGWVRQAPAPAAKPTEAPHREAPRSEDPHAEHGEPSQQR